MQYPQRHNFDRAAYLEAHPAALDAVEAGEYESLYQHMIVNSRESPCPVALSRREQPLVSIVVPCYQSEQFLEATLESIRQQTYSHWECIAVNDFSTDSTLGIIKKYVAKDSRFKLLTHRANGGANAARNSGIRSARGRLICFLDSDDLMMPTSIANRVRALRAGDSERLAGTYSGSETIDESCSVPPSTTLKTEMRLIDFVTASGLCPFNANQPMFKTSVLRLLGGFDQRLSQAEDWEFWMRILRHGYYLVPTRVVDVTYRARAASMVRHAPMDHLDTSLWLYESAHCSLPSTKRYEGTPFVYDKPWLEYKRQLDIAKRVLEFSGMALSTGEEQGRIVDTCTSALPDFFSAIATYRDLARGLESGVRRHMVGASDEDVRYAAQLLINDFVGAWKNTKQETSQSVSGVYPDAVGLNVEAQREAEVLFFPHKDYHVWGFSLILEALQEAGISYQFVDMSVIYRDERAKGKLAELGLPSVSYNEFVLGNYKPKLLVCMNDWDPIVRRIMRCGQRLGIPTVGVVEGVQDYHDADTGRTRETYQTVDYVLLPGEFDARYFAEDSDKVRVGGVPRIDELLRESNDYPETPLVIINSNFSYNVLTEHRDEWVRTAVAACVALGYDYLISRHPADIGDFSKYQVGEESMYDLIRRGSVFVSRFGSGILESLAMGKPSVYYNPHGEKIDKFTEPNGAFPVSLSQEELERDLRSTVEDPQRWLACADDYVYLHCGTRKNASVTATQRLSTEMVDIFRSAKIPSADRRARLKYLLCEQGELLLGAEDEFKGQNRLTRAVPHGLRALGEGVAHMAGDRYQESVEGLQKKYRKFRRDPKAFLGDSKLSPLRALERLL